MKYIGGPLHGREFPDTGEDLMLVEIKMAAGPLTGVLTTHYHRWGFWAKDRLVPCYVWCPVKNEDEFMRLAREVLC